MIFDSGKDIFSYCFQFGTLAAMLLPTTPPGRNKEHAQNSSYIFCHKDLFLFLLVNENSMLFAKKQANKKKSDAPLPNSENRIPSGPFISAHTEFPKARAGGGETGMESVAEKWSPPRCR